MLNRLVRGDLTEKVTFESPVGGEQVSLWIAGEEQSGRGTMTMLGTLALPALFTGNHCTVLYRVTFVSKDP